jgi:hypothetical protein
MNTVPLANTGSLSVEILAIKRRLRRWSAWAAGFVVVMLAAGARAQDLTSDSSKSSGTSSTIAGQEPVSNKALYRRRVQVSRGALDLQVGAGYQQGVGAIGGDVARVQDVAGVGAGGDIGVGYRLSPYWMLGGYGSAAWYKAMGDQEGLHSFAIGVQAQLHMQPRRSIDPWFGLGIGYRVFSFTAAGQPTSVHQAIELPRLTIGVDYRASYMFSVGPYVSADVALFMNESRPGQPTDTRTTLASFLGAGLAGRFDLFGTEPRPRPRVTGY